LNLTPEFIKHGGFLRYECNIPNLSGVW
jgi:hypothetical protein